MSSGVYKLTFPNGQLYIGKSVDMERRWLEHADSMRNGTAAKKLQNAYIMSGFPDADVMIYCHPDHIGLMESYFIIKLQPQLNSSPPLNLTTFEIETLGEAIELLQEPTTNHLVMIKNMSNEISKLTEAKKELEETLRYVEEDLASKTNREELKLDIGRRLSIVAKEKRDLEKQLKDSKMERDYLQIQLNKPWWKKLFN